MLTDLRTLWLLLPEIIIIVMAVWIYLGGTFTRSRNSWTAFAVLTFFAASVVLYRQGVLWLPEHAGLEEVAGSTGPLTVDLLGYLARWGALLIGLLLVLMVSRSGPSDWAGEYLGSLLLATAGLMLACTAGDLVMLFLGLELISIPTYVILFLGRNDRPSGEAAIKYFFLSILSSALLLYGFSFLYGAAGTTRLADIQMRLLEAGDSPALSMLPMALILIFSGLAFKIAAVPFHFYAPDVYQGTTNANAALLAVVPKVAGIVVLVRLLAATMPPTAFAWQLVLVLAVATMTLGNVCALWQKHIRRLMAYSSIAHGGYMLIGLAVALAAARSGAGQNGLAAMLFYLTVYCAASLGTFAALAYLSNDERQIGRLDELAGLGRTQPTIAAAIALCMFSLAGIPPLVGFWGKMTLFTSALQLAGEPVLGPWFIALAVIGALNAAIAAAYYLRVIGTMYFREPERAIRPQGGSGAGLATAACASILLAAGVLPGGLMERAREASNSVPGVSVDGVSVDGDDLTPADDASKNANAAPTSASTALFAEPFGPGNERSLAGRGDIRLSPE